MFVSFFFFNVIFLFFSFFYFSEEFLFYVSRPYFDLLLTQNFLLTNTFDLIQSQLYLSFVLTFLFGFFSLSLNVIILFCVVLLEAEMTIVVNSFYKFCKILFIECVLAIIFTKMCLEILLTLSFSSYPLLLYYVVDFSLFGYLRNFGLLLALLVLSGTFVFVSLTGANFLFKKGNSFFFIRSVYYLIVVFFIFIFLPSEPIMHFFFF